MTPPPPVQPPAYDRYPGVREPAVTVEMFAHVPDIDVPRVEQERVKSYYLGPSQTELAEGIVDMVKAAEEGKLPANWRALTAASGADSRQAEMLARYFPDGPTTEVGQAAQEALIGHDAVLEDLTQQHAAEEGRAAQRKYLVDFIESKSAYQNHTMEIGDAKALRDKEEPAAAQADAAARDAILALPEDERRKAIGVATKEDRIIAAHAEKFAAEEQRAGKRELSAHNLRQGAAGVAAAVATARAAAILDEYRSGENRTADDARRRTDKQNDKLQRLLELQARFEEGLRREIVGQTLDQLAARVAEIRNSGLPPAIPDRTPAPLPIPAPPAVQPQAAITKLPPHVARSGAPGGPGDPPRVVSGAERRGSAVPNFNNIRLQLAYELGARDAVQGAVLQELGERGTMNAKAMAAQLGVSVNVVFAACDALNQREALTHSWEPRSGSSSEDSVYTINPQEYQLPLSFEDTREVHDDDFFRACAGPVFEMMAGQGGDLSLKEIYTQLAMLPYMASLERDARDLLVADLIDHMVTTRMVEMWPDREGMRLFLPGWGIVGEGLNNRRLELVNNLIALDRPTAVYALATLDETQQDVLLALAARGGEATAQQIDILLAGRSLADISNALSVLADGGTIHAMEAYHGYSLYGVNLEADDRPARPETLDQLVPEVRQQVISALENTTERDMTTFYGRLVFDMGAKAGTPAEGAQVIHAAIAGLWAEGAITIATTPNGRPSTVRLAAAANARTPLETYRQGLIDPRYQAVVTAVSLHTGTPFTIESLETSLPKEIASFADGVVRDMAHRGLVLDKGDGTYITALSAGQARSPQQPSAAPAATVAPAPQAPPEQAPTRLDEYSSDARQIFRRGELMNTEQVAAELGLGANLNRVQDIIDQLKAAGIVTGDTDSGYRANPPFIG